MPSELAIVGAGALGCLFGARLAAHAEVTILSRWREQIEHLRAAPLELEEMDGSSRRVRLAVRDEPRRVGPVPLVFVLVKSPGTERAAADAAAMLAPDGLALTLQNGLGNFERLARVLGPGRSAVGVTYEGATALGPGRVRHAGSGMTSIATGPETAERVAAAAALLQRAGLRAEVVAQADVLLWSKLVVNTAVNPLAALLGVRNGELLEVPARLDLLRRAAQEAAGVARALGLQLGYPDAADKAVAVCRASAGNRASMLQDLERGVHTEIDAIAGAVVAAGRRVGVATPVAEAFWRLVREREGSPPPRDAPNHAAKRVMREIAGLLAD